MSSTNIPAPEGSPPGPAAQTTGASVARGGLWQIVGTVVPQLYGLTLSVFLAHYLGPDALGRLALIQVVAFTLITSLTLGLPTALVNFTGVLNGSGRAGEARTLLRWTSRLIALTAAVALAVMAGLGVLGASPKAAWILEGIGAAAGVVATAPASFLRGLQRWRVLQVAAVASGGVAFALKVVALLFGGGVTAICAIDIVAFGGTLAVTAFFAGRAARALPAAPLDVHLRRSVLRFAGISSISVFVSFVVYHRTEVLFLGHYSSDAQIAIYWLPFTVVSGLMALTWALGAAFGPAVATLWGAQQIDRIRAGFSRSVRLALLANLLLASALTALGPIAVELVWGRKFAGAGPVLVILAVTLPFAPLMTLSLQLLNGIGRLWGLSMVGVVAALSNIGLDLVLIPRYDAVGAALANSLAQIVGSVPLIVLAGRALGGLTLEMGVLGRAVAAAVASGLAAALVLNQLPGAAGLVAGALAFVVALAVSGVLLRPISVDDFQWLESISGGRVGGLLVATCRYASAGQPLPLRGKSP